MSHRQTNQAQTLIFGREISLPRTVLEGVPIRISPLALSGLDIIERRELLNAKQAQARSVAILFERELNLAFERDGFITSRLQSGEDSKHIGPHAPTNGYAYKITLFKDQTKVSKQPLIFWAPMKEVSTIKNDERIFYLSPEDRWITWDQALSKAKDFFLGLIKLK